MKGPGIKDYLEVIENMKVTAQKEGKAFIEVNSKGAACEREPKPCNDANLLPGDLQADAGRR